MHRQILKRHGNYILRTREFIDAKIIYNWYYSKELSQLLKNQRFIENWQLDNLRDGLTMHTQWHLIEWFKMSNFAFKSVFKDLQKGVIKELLQCSNKVGKYA